MSGMTLPAAETAGHPLRIPPCGAAGIEVSAPTGRPPCNGGESNPPCQLKRLSAREELAVMREFPALIPGLCARGLGFEDAAALAHNITYVYYAAEAESAFKSPEDVLSRLSLEEIAEYCSGGVEL